MQEVSNAVDQASREVTTRFDFKDTDSTIELSRPRAPPALGDRGPPPGPGRQVRRGEAGPPQGVPEGARLRQGRGGGQGHGPPDDHPQGRASRRTTPGPSTASSRTRRAKGISSQTQGDQIRVTGKKRDDLQAVIAALQGRGLRHPPPVRELPGLTGRRRARLRARLAGSRDGRLSGAHSRLAPAPVAEAAMRSSVGGWVVEQVLERHSCGPVQRVDDVHRGLGPGRTFIGICLGAAPRAWPGPGPAARRRRSAGRRSGRPRTPGCGTAPSAGGRPPAAPG